MFRGHSEVGVEDATAQTPTERRFCTKDNAVERYVTSLVC